MEILRVLSFSRVKAVLLLASSFIIVACLCFSFEGNSVFYLVESSKSFAEVIFDLEPVVQRLGFVVLNSHDLGEILRRKAIDMDEDCQVFDLCNYRYMEKLLAVDMRFGLFLPWRLTVLTENGATKIGLIRPTACASVLGEGQPVGRIIAEMEEKMVLMVDEVR